METLSVIFDVVIVLAAIFIAERAYRKDAQKGLILMGKSFALSAAFGVAFFIGDALGTDVLGIIDYTPTWSTLDYLSMLALSVLVVLIIEKLTVKKK